MAAGFQSSRHRQEDEHANGGIEALLADIALLESEYPAQFLTAPQVTTTAAGNMAVFTRVANTESYFASSGIGGGYDPDMVAAIRRADAAAPEAKFHNFKDMMDWLDRD